MTLKGTNGTNGIDCHWLIALLQSGCLDHAILLFANGPKCEPTNASSTTCYSVKCTIAARQAMLLYPFLIVKPKSDPLSILVFTDTIHTKSHW